MQDEAKHYVCDLKENIAKENKISMNLQKTLQKISTDEGFIKYKLETKKISTKDGNLSLLFETHVKGKTLKGDEERFIFIKNIIADAVVPVTSLSDAYLKEAFVYKDLFQMYTKLQEEANIPKAERFKMVKCFYGDSEAIYLENLTQKAYKTPHRMECVSIEFAKHSIRQLARFHGLSYVLERTNPEYFRKNVQVLEHPFTDKVFCSFIFENGIKKVLGILDSAVRKNIESNIPNLLKKYFFYTEDRTFGGCCLNHGDFKSNNILVKENKGEVTDVIPVDYQLCYYGCPINDFMFFIFTSTDKIFREKYLVLLKNVYYNALQDFLQFFEIDVNDIYSMEVFEKQYNERLEFGLAIGFIITAFCFNADDLKKNGCEINFKLDNRYVKRIKGLVDDFTEWGVL